MATKRDATPSELELSDGDVPIATLAFTLVFYADVPLSRLAKPALEIYERFLAAVGKETLGFYATDTMTKHKGTTARAFDMLPTWLRPGAPRRDAVAITLQNSAAFNAAPQSYFVAYGSEPADGQLVDEASILRLGFPVTYGIDRADEMFELFVETCSLAPFRNAHAGFAFTCSKYGEWEYSATEHAWAKSMRHPGAGIVDTVNEMITVGVDGLMEVDWLTFIDERFIEKLGGISKISKAVAAKSDAVKPQPLSKGLVLRAGDKPRFGDVNRGDKLPEYKAVFSTLQPLMTEAFDRARSLSLKDDEEARTLSWLQRHSR